MCDLGLFLMLCLVYDLCGVGFVVLSLSCCLLCGLDCILWTLVALRLF